MTNPDIQNALKQADETFFSPYGLAHTLLLTHPEGQDYGACRIMLNGRVAEFRIGKATPKKLGFFATLWHRSQEGLTIPFDLNDKVELFIISAAMGLEFGLFVFPKIVLFQQGYVSKHGIGGKRAMRIYPSWEINLNATAHKTKKWQAPHFIDQNLPPHAMAHFWQTRWPSGKA